MTPATQSVRKLLGPNSTVAVGRIRQEDAVIQSSVCRIQFVVGAAVSRKALPSQARRLCAIRESSRWAMVDCIGRCGCCCRHPQWLIGRSSQRRPPVPNGCRVLTETSLSPVNIIIFNAAQVTCPPSGELWSTGRQTTPQVIS